MSTWEKKYVERNMKIPEIDQEQTPINLRLLTIFLGIFILSPVVILLFKNSFHCLIDSNILKIFVYYSYFFILLWFFPYLHSFLQEDTKLYYFLNYKTKVKNRSNDNLKQNMKEENYYTFQSLFFEYTFTHA